MKIKNWRLIHRISGLFVVGFLLLYTFSGLLLNHRKTFNNFLYESGVVRERPLTDPRLLSSFVEKCKVQIGRNDDPVVIIIRDNKIIDFRYDRHGYESFLLDPGAATITAVKKEAQEPWHAMKWLHVAYRTTPLWVVVSDIIALLILLTTFSGLFSLRYRRWDIMVVLGGIFIFVAAVLVG